MVESHREAIRLHNLICRSSSVLEELEELEAKLLGESRHFYDGEKPDEALGRQRVCEEYADRIHALIGRYREPK